MQIFYFLFHLFVYLVILKYSKIKKIYLYFAGRNLSMLPVEPKLGKMLILGAIFNCLDPVMTIVAGLSVRDPFLMPFDKKDVSLLTVSTSDKCFTSLSSIFFSSILLLVKSKLFYLFFLLTHC